VTLLGTVTFALPLVSDTTEPPAGAAEVIVTVHAEVPGAFTVADEQFKLLRLMTVGGTNASVAVWLTALSVAVTMTFIALFTVPVEAVKFALLWPAATVTFAGTVTAAFPLAKETEVALAADLFNATVQALVALLPSVEGAQERPTSVAGPLASSVNVCVLPSVAVSSAVWSDVTAATVAVNPAEVCP
jgi:hypothetical protein